MDISRRRIQLLEGGERHRTPHRNGENKHINSNYHLDKCIRWPTMQTHKSDIATLKHCSKSVREATLCLSILQVNSFMFSLGGLYGPRPFLFWEMTGTDRGSCLLFSASPSKCRKDEAKVIWTPKGSAILGMHGEKSLSHTFTLLGKITYSRFLSVRGRSARRGRFLGGNRGITVCCHTPKYSAYRDINRSRGKTDRHSCGLL